MKNSYQRHMDQLVKEAPNQIPQERVDTLLGQTFGGVTLSILNPPGTRAFALLGLNITDGEVQFVDIEEDDEKEKDNGKIAMVRALKLLCARCGGQSLPYHTMHPTQSEVKGTPATHNQCKGRNCRAIDGVGHSDECENDHADIINK